MFPRLSSMCFVTFTATFYSLVTNLYDANISALKRSADSDSTSKSITILIRPSYRL